MNLILYGSNHNDVWASSLCGASAALRGRPVAISRAAVTRDVSWLSTGEAPPRSGNAWLERAIAAKDTPSFILPPSVFLFLTLSFSLSLRSIYLQTDMREAHAITVTIAIHPNCTCVCSR